MPTLEAQRTKRTDVAEQIAAVRFPFPSDERPDWRTVVNLPDGIVGIQIRGGGWIYADIVVVAEPGNFVELLAIVALRHEINEAEAVSRWLPLSKAGPLSLFVPVGQAGRANRLCRELRIPVAGVRTWRRTPSFGLAISDAYSGPDLIQPILALLPSFLRPRVYRFARQAREIAP